jgi:hypothetical protein
MPEPGRDIGGTPPGPDRYDPLPSLPAIPRHLWRKLSSRGRRIAGAAGALLLVAAVAGLVLGGPRIDEGKRDRAAREAARAAAARAELERRLSAEQRPIRGHGPAAGGLPRREALEARRALVAGLASAVERDARARRRAGEIEEAVRSVTCEPFPRSTSGADPAARLDRPSGRYACLAVTANIPAGGATVGGAVGYPYRARVAFPGGTFTYCKVSGRPGEKALPARPVVTVPRACGGGP